MRVYEFLHWYYSHKLWCKLYLYLSHLLNQFFKFRFILYKRIWSILPISHHCTPFKILLICSARYFHAKPWSMDEGLLQGSKTLALHPSFTAFPVDISAIRNYGKRTRTQ